MNKKALQDLCKQKCSTKAVHNNDPRPDPSNQRWTVVGQFPVTIEFLLENIIEDDDNDTSGNKESEGGEESFTSDDEQQDHNSGQKIDH